MDWLAAVAFAVLIVTLVIVTVEWLRRGGAQRRDVTTALLPMIVAFSYVVFGESVPTWWSIATVVMFLLAPILFLRLVRHLQPVPTFAYVFSLAVTGGAALAQTRVDVPPRYATSIWLAAVLAPYVLAAMILAQSSLARRGVGRRRMQWAAASGLLTALVWVLSIPGMEVARNTLGGSLIVMAFSVSYVYAFATPRSLRESWRAVEFQRFVAGTYAGADENLEARLERMRVAAGSVVEADAAFLLVEGDDGAIYVSQDEPFPADDETAWQMLDTATDEPVVIDGWTVIGLQAPDQPRRALVIRLSGHRLFPGEDEETMKAVATEIRSRFTELVFREMETRAREAAEELATFRSEYLRAVAHEIANPLTPIKMQLAILKRKHAEESPAPFQRINKSLERVEALIRDVSTIARLGSAGIKLETAELDLSQMVLDAVDAYVEVAKEGGCRIRAEVEPGITLPADGLRIRQIIDNLCSNAIKYSPDGGQVTVTARVRAGLAEVIIADQGLGMTRDQMDRLFSSYGRVHTDVRPEIPGTGMGLYIARQLARLHGGDLEVFSEGAGKGTRFKLSLPTDGPPDQVVQAEQPPLPGVRIKA